MTLRGRLSCARTARIESAVRSKVADARNLRRLSAASRPRYAFTMKTSFSPGHFSGFPALPDSAADADLIGRERTFGARNYDPLPVVLAHGTGSWVTDVDGRRYLDLMSAYSAVSFGHSHPRIVGALVEPAQRLGVTSRAYFNDRLPLLFERLAQLTGLDRVLPSNGGAEAVETAIKAARKWGYRIKGIPDGHAEIIGCRNNFHGRTITITG